MRVPPFLSKALKRGQWRTRARVWITPACLIVGLCAFRDAARPASQADFNPPRYATLRAAPVNARVGPGEDYKALWTYQVKGVPVQVVEESEDWRRICDPEGGLSWVRARTLEARRTVMRVRPSDLPMRRAPSADARITAVLAGRALASLLGCEHGWCRISVDHASGWVRPDDVWGTGEGRQCR